MKLTVDWTGGDAFRFEEMPTNNFVESSFWNFDALFQPQQHPARDAHDTFFMTSPCPPRVCPPPNAGLAFSL